MPLSLEEALIATRNSGYAGMGYGVGYGGGLGKSGKGAAMAAQAAEDEGLRRISTAESKIKRAIERLRGVASSMSDRADAYSRQGGGYEIQSQAQRLEAIAQRLAQSSTAAEDLLRQASEEAANRRAGGGYWAHFSAPAYESAAARAENLARDADTAESEARTVGLKLERARETERAAVSAEQLRYEEQRRQDEIRRQDEQRRYEQQRADEAARRQAEIDAQRAMQEEARAARQAEIDERRAQQEREVARIQAEREAAAAERQYRLELAAQERAAKQEREARLLEMEQMRLQQEEEREAKRQEREDADRQFQMMLKLMEKGLPMPGMMPGAPGAMTPYSGTATYPFQFPQAPMGPPMGMPQGAPTMMMPGAPPPVVQPQGGSGIEFGPMSPGAELFGFAGMGELQPARIAHPHLPPTAEIEEGYKVDASTVASGGYYTITAPAGHTIKLSVKQSMTDGVEVLDPKTGRLFYKGPDEGRSTAEKLGFVRSIIDIFGAGAKQGAEAYATAKGRKPAPPAPEREDRGGGGGDLAGYAVGAVVLGGVGYGLYKWWSSGRQAV